ncbi:MAG: biotin--[acetyl-CoA-carboxylase] ligase [Gammaproteobacteria bacterium]|nr:biotin--[acetyl-CoA-carboxylase] ligase [Gammaproteobacteria bacterium]MBT8111235.1 biotin--[acetyl-CoA-carboxylase] ligase [Gammaproteobacteria bacterium]NND47640.1 biotin--[acetyl-CoA-carboxylase] ligase [Woeseiaceae bacterium]NNL45933.1 biotin--[acetyl-CoA-carboxylase] ligase [Woeseiaceae bacterium]
MNNFDSDVIRRNLGAAAAARLGRLEIFAEIDSTNSYLMQQPAPAPGKINIALTDNQTAGRGRHGRTWQSPPGSGLCLSLAYTFALPPPNLPALTLALGLGVIRTLGKLNAMAVQLKWPNDLIALGCKLGGILTESRAQPDGAMTVVTGIGLNIDLGERADAVLELDDARRAIDLKSQLAEPPDWNRIAAALVNGLSTAIVDFEARGFAAFSSQWAEHDWLFGREVTISTSGRRITGRGAGIGDDGALLVDTVSDGTQRVTSGSVVTAGAREAG